MTAVNWSDFTPVDAEPASESGSVDWSKFEPIQPAGPARKLSDIGASFAGGAVGATKAIADAGGAGNAVSQRLDGAQDVVQGWLSPARQAEKTARAQIISEAEKSGSTLREVGAHLGAFAEAPVSTVAEAAGSVVPVVGAMLTPAGRSAAARTLLGIGLGAAQGAGSVKGSIYDAVQQKHIEQGATPEVARQAAEQAQAYTGLNTGSIAVGAGLGVVAGTSGVEGVVSRAIAGKAAAGGASMVRRSAVGAVAEGLPEALQGGQERLATNQALQQQGFDVPTWQGVAGQAAAEGLAGGVLGGGVNAASRGHARLDAAPAPRVNVDDPSVGADAAAPIAPAQAAPAIDPTAGPLSKAASKVGGLALAPQGPDAVAAPAAAPQPSMAELAAQVENLPTDLRRDARFTLTELQRQDLPAGVRAFHEDQLRTLAGQGNAPTAEAIAPVEQQPVGDVVRQFDAREPTQSTPAWIEQFRGQQPTQALLPSQREALADMPRTYALADAFQRSGGWEALKQDYLSAGAEHPRQVEIEDAFAVLQARDRSTSPQQRAEALAIVRENLGNQLGAFEGDSPDVVPRPALRLAPQQPVRYDGGIDFNAPDRPTSAQADAPNADAQAIARLALAENIEPGEPMQLNRAHALRRAAVNEGIPVSVIPHPSGRGYTVAPTARLEQVTRASMPQDEAAALLPFDTSLSGRMVAGQDGVRAEARSEAVNHQQAVQERHQSEDAQAAHRQQLGTPVPRGAETQSLQPHRNGEPNGPQAQQATPQQPEAPSPTAVERHPTWRTNAIQAGRVARALGLDPKGKRLAQVVADIDAHDSEQNKAAALAVKAPVAIESGAKSPQPQTAALDMRSAELAADEAQYGPYPSGAASRNGNGQWAPAVKAGPDGGQAIPGAPVFADASAAARWSQLEQLKGRSGADVDSLVRQQGGLTNPSGGADSTPVARAGDIARGFRDEIDNVTAPDKRADLYREKALYLRDAAEGMSSGSEALQSFTAAVDMLDAWAGQVGQETSPPTAITPKNGASSADTASAAPDFGSSGASENKPASISRGKRTTISELNKALGLDAKAQVAIESVASNGREVSQDGDVAALFSARPNAPKDGLPLEKVQQLVQEALSGLRNPPPVDVVLRAADLGLDAPDGVMGVRTREGRIAVVASAHGSDIEVFRTVFHELFHHGLRNILPARDYVQTMLDLAKRDGRVRQYAINWKNSDEARQQRQALADAGFKGMELTAQFEALAIEEGLAVVAEELRADKAPGTRQKSMRIRVLAGWLANVADKLGMGRLADSVRKMTYNQAERFVLDAIGNAGRAPINPDGADVPRYRSAAQIETPAFLNWFGESHVVDGAGQPLRVFHGTGGDFNVFSRDRAGTTTGAANAGMGFFFTDRPEVAGNYARVAGGAQNILPVYLSLKNPLRLEAKNMMEADKLLQSDLQQKHDGAIIQVATRDGGTQTVFMIRESGQVKSATGNRGTFDPSNVDIRYRVRGENPTAERVGDALKAVTVANLKQQAGFKATDYMGLGLQLLGRRQLVDVYGKLLPQLSTYNGLMAQMDADKNEAGAGADELATAWGKLDEHPKFGLGPAKYPGMERKLAELMHDATLAQIDPSKDFVDGDNKTDWNRLRAQYQALSPAAKDVYARARDTYSDHTSEVRKAIKERIERSGMGSERKDALLQRMDDELFGRIKGVYFPLARFGQYLVVVKDAEGKTVNVSRAETMAEAQAARQQLQAPFPASKGFTVGKVLKANEFIADRDAVGRGFMEQLYGVLDKQNMDGKQKAELEDALGQLYLSAMPDLSWAKHGIHRKGTPGFSQDARRAFAQNVFHGARYLAKLRYSDLLQDELNAMDKHVSARDSDAAYDSVRGRQVVDEMNKRHDAAMNPQGNPLSTALTSAGFVFYLGLSPASAMVNLSQTALVAYPVMAAKWGYAKSAAALLSASKQAAVNRNDISGALNADEKAAYDEAVRAGVIDVTMAHDLAGIAQGEDSGVMWKVRPVMKWASFLFHHAEKFNRQVTFVAAYRLAREGGADATHAYADAAKATYDGHFDYSSNNRPRVMQGNAARVLLLFKQFGQNMVYTVARQAQQSLKGASPKERAEARKALGGLLAMHGMAAGVLGLPMVTTLLAAASMLGGDDDEPWDAQVALQNMLADAFGQKPAEVLAHGLSRLTPWDASGRVGLDRLILPDLQEGLEGQRLGESAMAAALGPVAGIFVNLFKGVQEMGEGRYMRGLETMMPTALRSPLKALRYANEGAQDKSGISILDEVGAAGVAGQVIGLSPSNVRNAQEGKSAIVHHDRALQARRSSLVEQFAMAAMAGDEDGKVDARESIARFNEKNPDRRILPMQLAQSVRMRTKRIEQAQDGVYLPTKRRNAMDVGRFAVPD